MLERIIAIDFDGTCVTHEYPAIGKEIGAARVIKQLADIGHKIILYTMRDGSHLQDAIDWFTDNSIMLYGINLNPQQSQWTQSPKIFANLYIDDAALGTPLKSDPLESRRPYVDWEAVEALLVNSGILVEHQGSYSSISQE